MLVDSLQDGRFLFHRNCYTTSHPTSSYVLSAVGRAIEVAIEVPGVRREASEGQSCLGKAMGLQTWNVLLLLCL